MAETTNDNNHVEIKGKITNPTNIAANIFQLKEDGNIKVKIKKVITITIYITNKI